MCWGANGAPLCYGASAGDVYGAGGGAAYLSDQRCRAVYCCSADYHAKRLCEIPVNRLIIFEALAVNAGSLLTPIGNPQNILIWGRSGLSFAGFIAQMAPLAGAMMLTLLLLCWCCFLERHCNTIRGQTPEWKPRLVWSCLGLYIVFLTALELKQELWGLVIVAAGFALLARRVVLSVDWTLLLVFMAMFIDVHLLTQLPALQGC